MKIIVTSDIHGKKEIITKLLYEYDGDLFLDCGDSELSNYDLQNFESVRGNCDFENYPNYSIIEIDEYLKIFITHGHLYTIEEMLKISKKNKCNMILHGHTHIKKYEIIDEIYILNPGSITKPRNKDSNTFLEIFYDIINKKINCEFVKIVL